MIVNKLRGWTKRWDYIFSWGEEHSKWRKRSVNCIRMPWIPHSSKYVNSQGQLCYRLSDRMGERRIRRFLWLNKRTLCIRHSNVLFLLLEESTSWKINRSFCDGEESPSLASFIHIFRCSCKIFLSLPLLTNAISHFRRKSRYTGE